MDFVLRIVVLLFIICVCVILVSYTTKFAKARMQSDVDNFTASGPESGCLSVVLQAMQDNPENAGKSRNELKLQLDQFLTMPVQPFLQSQGIDTSAIPTETLQQIKEIKLTDVLSMLSRNYNIDANGKAVPMAECLVPMTVLKQFADQTNSSTVQLRDNINPSVTDDPNSVFYNNLNKQCKIGNTYMRTNIPKSVTSRDDDYMAIDNYNAQQYGMDDMGCIFTVSNATSQPFKDMLADMYTYTKTKTMQDIRDAVGKYVTSVKDLDTATNKNLVAKTDLAKAQSVTAGARNNAEQAKQRAATVKAAIPPAKDNLDTSVVRLQNAINNIKYLNAIKG